MKKPPLSSRARQLANGLRSTGLLAFLFWGNVAAIQAQSTIPSSPNYPPSLSREPWEKLAVQDRGRKKPFVAFAREVTQYITGKSSWRLADGTNLSDLAFTLRLWLSRDQLTHEPTILINSRPLWEKISDPKLPANHLSFDYLTTSPTFAALEKETEQFERLRPNDKLPPLYAEVRNVSARIDLYRSILSGEGIRLVPPPENSGSTWNFLGDIDWHQLAQFYQEGRWADLNQAIEKLGESARAYNPSLYPPAWLLQTEAIYLKIHPWRWAWICYALSAVILGLTLQWQQKNGGRLGYGFGLLGFAFQVYGFISRMIIAGRPPVSNMYESIIWVAFGSVLFALILEAIYRPRYFLLAATPFAVAALMFTDLQPTLFDPSIHPLVAVLNNNFWLSIHVLTITLSYGAFALALGLGHVIVIKSLYRASARELAPLFNYNYRTLQVGVLLLSTGTILGGVWANYSWGRFWDWDPKETWALITLLTYLVILHGRLAGWCSGFGLAVGSILCFQSVVMAWYGVNFVLGTGLHSYGFGTGGLPYAATFVALEIILVSWALMARRNRMQSI